ncbi:MAG: hypothetical protein WD316_02625 [Phycisphaeraceae bacterium]
MAARRNRATPFEVMGRGGVERGGEEPPAGGLAHAPAPPNQAGPEGADWPEREATAARAAIEGGEEAGSPTPLRGRGSTAAWWNWAGVGEPVVLRVPRGVAVAALVAVIGVAGLGYWVGHTRGYGAAEAAMVAEQGHVPREAPAEVGSASAGLRPAGGGPGQPVARPENAGQSAGAGASGAGAEASGGGGGGGASGGGGGGRVWLAHRDGDPRQAGLNYMVLAYREPEQGERLATFLAGHGLDVLLELRDNQRFVDVVAVGRGYARGQRTSDEWQDYEQHLRTLGRAWRQHNDGRGEALEDMYPRLHQ